MLIVADGAPGLIKAIEQCWPASDRQRCCVHRARNLYAKLPERVKRAYWQALGDAISERDGKQRLQALVDRLDKDGFARRRDAWSTIWTRSSCTCATRPGTAGGGDRRICSSDRSARSNVAPR